MTLTTTWRWLRKNWKNAVKVLLSIWVIGSTLPYLWRAITHPADAFRGFFMLCIIVGVIAGWKRAQELKKQKHEDRNQK